MPRPVPALPRVRPVRGAAGREGFLEEVDRRWALKTGWVGQIKARLEDISE